MPTVRISSKDKRELIKLALGFVGIGLLTLYIFNGPEINKAICGFVTGTSCDYVRHRYDPTWRSTMVGIFTLVGVVSAYATLIILRRSIHRPRNDFNDDESMSDIQAPQAQANQAPSSTTKPQSAPGTRTLAEPKQTPESSQTSTIHGAPTSQSSGTNVEVVPVETKQVLPLTRNDD